MKKEIKGVKKKKEKTEEKVNNKNKDEDIEKSKKINGKKSEKDSPYNIFNSFLEQAKEQFNSDLQKLNKVDVFIQETAVTLKTKIKHQINEWKAEVTNFQEEVKQAKNYSFCLFLILCRYPLLLSFYYLFSAYSPLQTFSYFSLPVHFIFLLSSLICFLSYSSFCNSPSTILFLPRLLLLLQPFYLLLVIINTLIFTIHTILSDHLLSILSPPLPRPPHHTPLPHSSPLIIPHTHTLSHSPTPLLSLLPRCLPLITTSHPLSHPSPPLLTTSSPSIL